MKSAAARRARVAIITPTLAASNTGNWHTAARWARFLRGRFRVSVSDRWAGEDVDCVIALHARRSAPSIHAFAAAHPERALIVVLTGTDLYRDLATDAQARKSLDLATRLVVLNELAPRRLSRRWRHKVTVILQSAPALAPGRRAARRFDVAVVGHLRAEKDPQLVWDMLQHLAGDVPLAVWHAGAALDARLGRAARALARRDPRYRWLGGLPRSEARQLMRRCHLLLHPSRMEGGAQAVIEAVTAHTPVIGTRIDGNVGLLGADYPGWFPVGDAAAAARLVQRAARDASFLRRLQRTCVRRARKFAPAHESAAVNRVVHNALRLAKRSAR
ncbi:MAG TPA: selenoneine biosynthesis selenosugar synthase SenB [Burkholderiaceae bacterium]|nr:selenoneine biosynthesis selenosugar synthase SenB [Burkholderiaceae bacterium]